MEFTASQHAFAQALLHADQPLPPGLTGARGTADEARFAVYRNNVHVGLTRALAQRFGVSEKLVGPDFFVGMARAYAQDRKPSSPLIIDYGDEFPDFIAGFAPARALPYLPDVARLEAAWTRAYHAADAAPLTLAVLAPLAPEDLATLILRPHPSAALLRSPHPVGSIWAAHQGTDVTPVDDWRPETVLVVRPEMAVNVHVLPVRDGLFAALLFAGGSLGAAAEATLAEDPGFDFGAALVGLLTLGAFAAIAQGDVP
ncbi:putative DNA-binding protein [Ancylobacter aquaticus]|uniref:Putative DNA-binding protein n=1 Tax=Ancylobacter aquaticus TaxID=100 RepID=A0A4R1I0V8_ANCAQ|nr:DNA-binding domain-containing protein [Ancylobacter aquaticus]TCK23542.1 putative DNA-binding protein [Ancylobacter aquaticus]